MNFEGQVKKVQPLAAVMAELEGRWGKDLLFFIDWSTVSILKNAQ